ncbi:hypothetical protein P3T76_012129 [Phytophthora citrophthora]|uniref:Uncharacterized protein n=1 Tax=Phytophthora citrophthora TaxID=4793 RepID=A0AAD9G653_9STRA|nr:hypothetical protein P3T76_012129 [Phytophthora citrophthora]
MQGVETTRRTWSLDPSMNAPPPLCSRNMQWWSCKYGSSSQYKQGTLSVDGFYCAIRDNQVDKVQRYITEHPEAVYTKLRPHGCGLKCPLKSVVYYLGQQPGLEQLQCLQRKSCAAAGAKLKVECQRTALYIASFFGRHRVVRLLLSRGADKDLLCNGQRPIDVAGFVSSDTVDRMKVSNSVHVLRTALYGCMELTVHLGAGNACPQVVLRLDDSASGSSTAAGTASETRRLRVQIHFSEPVTEFTLEDITVSDGCVVTSFSMLRTDLYVVTVQLPINVVDLSVAIPAGAARATRDGRCSAQSRPLQLAPAI